MANIQPLKSCIITIFLSLMSLLSFHAQAEQFQTIGNVQVHYSAFNTSDLSPAITQEYKIKRDGYTGLLNISVLDQKSTPSNPIAKTAQVSGSVKNLLGQTQPLTFKEIKEGKAIYYLASFKVTHEDKLQFNLNIDADDNNQGSLNFTQTFYVEE